MIANAFVGVDMQTGNQPNNNNPSASTGTNPNPQQGTPGSIVSGSPTASQSSTLFSGTFIDWATLLFIFITFIYTMKSNTRANKAHALTVERFERDLKAQDDAQKLAIQQHQVELDSQKAELAKHFQDHDWSRRKAAEDAVREFSAQIELRRTLERYLNWSTEKKLQSIGEFRKAILKADDKQIDEGTDYDKCDVECDEGGSRLIECVHRLLNYYESFARGISEGVYDERIIKRALHGQMTANLHRLKPYIDHRRSMNGSLSEKAWIDFESLLISWNNGALPEREKTGDASGSQSDS
jgi:hypothetical protein